MKTFEYTIKDELGIHARPAGLLVKEAKKFESECTITKDGKTKKLTQLMMLMSLGVKQGDTVTVSAEGADEDAAVASLIIHRNTHIYFICRCEFREEVRNAVFSGKICI